MSFPNPWDNPEFFSGVKIGGRPIKASLVELDGNKIEDEWSEQRPTGNSGATNVFKGTKPAGPCKLTFKIAGDSISALRDEWDDLREIWDLLAPKAGSGGNPTGTTVGSKGSAAYGQQYVLASSPASSQVSTSPDDLLKKAQAALAALQSGATPAAAGAGTGTTAASASSTASQPNPGPKPPTLSIENGYLNYVGITSVSRKSWDGPRPGPTNEQIVVLELVLQKDPVPAAVGKSAPKSPDNPGQKSIALGEIQDPANAAASLNAKAAQYGAFM